MTMFFKRLLDRWQPPKGFVLAVVATLVGIITALMAVGLIELLAQVGIYVAWFQKKLGSVAGMLTAMAVAGLIVGWMVSRWAKEAKGHGVPEVMQAVALHGGIMRPRVAFVKVIASAITIGAGGSAGREGPIVQIGSVLGSMFGQWFHFSHKRIRILVACGAAAGIAATFNTPIAGTIFALEVILASFTVRYFGAVVISAVAASVVSQMLLGRDPAFHVPQYPLHHFAELPIYMVLALLAAVVAVAFTRLLYFSEDLFDRLSLPAPLLAALGMVATGGFALLVSTPQVQGSGLHFMGKAIAQNINLPLSFLALLLLAKIIATCFTLGSGNSGGIFAPSLFLGAILGGIVGGIAHSLWPQIAPNPGAYAIVGMAAVFAGAARAPLTSLLIVFEMSHDYRLILPLMLCAVVSTFTAELLLKESIYTLKLKRKGINLQEGQDAEILQGVLVEEVMSRDFSMLTKDTTLAQLSDHFAHSSSRGAVILDLDGKLWGIVTLTDLEKAVLKGLPSDTPIEKFSRHRDELLVVHPDDTMGDALRQMGVRGIQQLPVVEHSDESHVLGFVERRHIANVYEMMLARRQELQHRTERVKYETNDIHFIEIPLLEHDPIIGKTLQEFGRFLPEECILVSIKRGQRLLIPHGHTIFQKGDIITAFVREQDTETLFHSLRASSSPPSS